MQSNYNFFSYYYDKLTQNVNYQKRAQYFQKVIEKYLGEEKCILLDLACGTGSLSEEFAKMGYDVIGVDYSEEMLNIALDKKFDSGLNIQYLCQDMRNIDMFGTVKVTVCALDSINHLSSLEDIKKVFEKVSLFTEPGGIFIFDINTKYKHKKILADNVYIYETDEVFCVWQNSYIEKNNEVIIKLDFFDKTEKNNYERYSEVFSEYAYEYEDFFKLLKDTGFHQTFCFDEDSFNAVHDKTERAIFVAVK